MACQGPHLLLGLDVSHVDEVLIGATVNVVICHGNRVHTATRYL